MKDTFQIGLRNILFIAIAASAAGGLESASTQDDDSGETTSEAVSALSGTQRVCSWATIRRTPGGQVFGFLLPGDNFAIDHCTTYWCYGHAYGHVHEDGWIEKQHLLGC